MDCELFKFFWNNIYYNGAAMFKKWKKLISSWIKMIDGKFNKGENVLILDEDHNKLARGLASFSSLEIEKIKGRQSNEIEKFLVTQVKQKLA